MLGCRTFMGIMKLFILEFLNFEKYEIVGVYKFRKFRGRSF